MKRIKLKCHAFVRDYLTHKFGQEVLITDKATEIRYLKTLMWEKLDREYAKDQIEVYESEFTVVFPETFVFPNGKVGFRAGSVQTFNSLIRDLLHDGLNRWMDTVLSEIQFQEKEMIFSYLQSQGIQIDNIKEDTWKKMRLRHKVRENGGPLRKKSDGSNVPKNVVMSFAHANT